MNAATKMFRIREVCNIVGLKPATIYKLVREHSFPKGIKLTKRSTAWPSDAIENWLQDRINGGQK